MISESCTERYLSNQRYFISDRLMLRGFYNNQCDMAMHHQEFAEIVFVLSGEADHFSRNAEEPVRRGSIFIVPPGGHHGYSNCHDLRVFVMIFAPDRLPIPLLDLYVTPKYRQIFTPTQKSYEELNKNYPMQVFSEAEFKEFERLLEIFDDLQQQKNNPGRDCEILGIFMCILGRICDLWRDENTVQRVDLSFDMKYITAYITKNINRNISLTELSALCCMSQNTLLRKFRKAFGKSPMNYIREQRLRLSTELLQNSSMRIDEIAAQCGFNSSSHFIAMFHQKYKCTPADFRMKSIDSGEFDHIVNAGE
jgi:AraC-like DNA-binding protein